MSNFVIPGVGTLTSTALTSSEMSVLWQQLLQQILGIDPATDPLADARVIVDWAPDGQPGFLRTDDVAFIQITEEPDAYNVIHEMQPVEANGDDNTTWLQKTIYTRVHRVSFDFWGPNSWDRARQSKSCVYLDFVHDTLQPSNLYLITEYSTPRRAPEKFAGQWWERVHFSVRMNEQVTETMVLPTIASVEIIIEDETGILSDQTVYLDTAGYGNGRYGITNVYGS